MKIISKEYIEQDGLDYWDLSIPDTNNYVLGNGAVVHNCGIGFSVQKQHIKKLPKIQKRTKQAKTLVVNDSIEGWADAVDALMKSFFVYDSEWAGRKIYFDLTEIRPKGSEISGGFKAPGPEPLRKALDLIEKKLKDELKDCKEPCALSTIGAYDIVMYIADAVISGGVRRAASICMFSRDDEDMIKCKTGDWFIENPQRGRSNNSAVLLRGSTQFEEFKGIMDSVKHSGEPGFVWTDDLDILFNPCMAPDTLVTVYDTKEYDITIKELAEMKEQGKKLPLAVSFNKITKTKEYKQITNAWLTHKNHETIEIELENGKIIKCTEDHKIWTENRGYVKAIELTEDDDLVYIDEF